MTQQGAQAMTNHAAGEPAERARPLDEWHDDMGDVLWWKFPVTEPPYCGSPLSLGHTVEVHADRYTGGAKMTEREKLADRIDPRKRPDAFIVLDGKRYANWASADADLIAAADILRASPAAALCAAAGEIAQFLADLPRERRQNFPTFKASFATIIARHLSSPSTYAAGYAAWVEAATSAQPSTAENPNESAYQQASPCD
jgi:hypothetical protein